LRLINLICVSVISISHFHLERLYRHISVLKASFVKRKCTALSVILGVSIAMLSKLHPYLYTLSTSFCEGFPLLNFIKIWQKIQKSKDTRATDM